MKAVNVKIGEARESQPDVGRRIRRKNGERRGRRRDRGVKLATRLEKQESGA